MFGTFQANYQFGWQARASGKGYGGYGSGERGYGGDSAEFGHSESRAGDKTTGKYFVQLPDGRLQTVEYYVDGYSGYVAKVSYSGGGYGSGERGYGGAARPAVSLRGGSGGSGGSDSDGN